jgi:hypothetical protein
MVDSGEMVGELVGGECRGVVGLWLRCFREGGGRRTESRIGQKRAGRPLHT